MWKLWGEVDYERTFKPNKTYTYYSCNSLKTRKKECLSPLRFDVCKLDQCLLDKILSKILTNENLKTLLIQLERLRAKLLDGSRSHLNKLHYELNTIQRRIDNLLDAVADGTLDRKIVKGKIEKLRKDKEATAEGMTKGQIIPFPKLNTSNAFLERLRGICREMIIEGDPIRGRTFLKRFIDRIILTKDTCEVAYDLSGIIPSNEDCSSLKEGLVKQNRFEPPTYK